MNFFTPRTRPQARLARRRFAGRRPRAAHAPLLLFAAALAALAAGPSLVGSRAAAPNASTSTAAAPRFATAPRALQAADAWTPIGPAAGVVVDLAASPSSPAVVYVAVDVESGDFAPTGNGAKVKDGLYKSTDGGLTWAATGLTGLTLHTVAVDPANADTVYAGAFRSGVFRSRDGGQTWEGPTRPANMQEADAFALAVHPQTTSTVYVSFSGRGLHRSTDGGVTWTLVTGFDPGFFGVFHVTFDPQSPSTVYAAAGGIAVTFGVYKSTDGGQSWNRMSAGLPSTDLTSGVAIDPSNTSVLYVGTGTAGTGASGIYKSTNGGQSWAAASTGLPTTPVTELNVDPTNTSVVIAATFAGVYRTANGGQSWAATGLAPTAAHSLARLHNNPSALLAGTRGLGVFRSSDAGATWAASGAGLPRPFVRHLAVSTNDPARIYAGTDDGVYLTGDRGDSWSLGGILNFRRSILGLVADPLNPSNLYAAVDFAGVFKSTNGGATWSAIFQQGSHFPALAIDPSSPSTLYLSVDGFEFYKTTNGGALFGNVASPGDASAIAVDPTNPQLVYAGTSFTVARSTNGGASWASSSLRSNFQSGEFVKSLTIDPNNPSTIYAAIFPAQSNPRSAFRSADAGRTWQPVFADSAAQPLVVAVTPGEPNVVYAGTASGVVRSVDGGQTSQPFGDGIPAGTAVHALSFDAAGQYLYAGTTNGVYRLQTSPCGELVAPTSQSFTAAGGGNSFVVTAVGAGCSPGNPASGADWITISSLSATTGGVQVGYTVAPNEGNRRGGVIRLRDQVFHVAQAAAPAAFAFGAAEMSAGEGDPAGAQITITRSGDTSFQAAVSYATVDDPAAVPCDPTATQPDGAPFPKGAAYARCDYSTTVDTLFFLAGETSKTVRVPLVDDGHAEGPETFRLALSQPASGASLGAQSSATVTITDNDAADAPNPINGNRFFVRMQYLDFLSREPEAGEPWTAVLDRCPNVNGDPSCDRVLVSQSFFLSPEFQLKGFFVYNFYKVAFGRLPLYVEITPDMRSVTGQTPQEVFGKRFVYSLSFVNRPEFKTLYDPMTNEQYVAALAARYGLQRITTPDPANPDGDQKVTLTLAELTGRLDAGFSRAQILRAFVQSDEVNAAEFNRAFVAMQYFGYLRRDPEPTGYQAWLTYLETHPGDHRTMVNGFVNAPEYVLRFGRR